VLVSAVNRYDPAAEDVHVAVVTFASETSVEDPPLTENVVNLSPYCAL
jgi:hypothetical protein